MHINQDQAVESKSSDESENDGRHFFVVGSLCVCAKFIFIGCAKKIRDDLFNSFVLVKMW